MEINIENLRPSWKVKKLLSGRHRVNRPQDHPLKSFFAERGITLAKLAALLGVSLGSVFAWMTGKYPPSPPVEILLRQIQKKILA